MAMSEAKRERAALKSPQLLTPEVHDKIVRMIRVGNYFETASKSAGIMPDVARNWRLIGTRRKAAGVTAADDPCVRFVEAIELAEGEAEANAVTILTAAGAKNWQALAWRLERRYPRRWGQRVRIEVANAVHALLDALKEELPRDLFLRVCEIAAQFEAGEEHDKGVPEDLPATEGAEADELH